MKKLYSLFFVMLLAVNLCACSSGNTHKSKKAAEADVDLTALSSTMVLAEVNNMMVSPWDYVGKSVKMKGQFVFYNGLDENGQPIDDQLYFACLIADATGCCAQGIEFVLEGEHSYPEDYPKEGEDITVMGTFKTYAKNGYVFCHLVDAVME